MKKSAPASEGFAARLQAAREAQGLTQRTLGALAGLHTADVSQYESWREPSMEAVRLLAQALGACPAELAFGAERQGLVGPELPDFAARLAFARERAHLGQRELGRLAELRDESYVSTLERGSKQPRIGMVKSLACALGVDPGWLAWGIVRAGTRTPRAA